MAFRAGMRRPAQGRRSAIEHVWMSGGAGEERGTKSQYAWTSSQPPNTNEKSSVGRKGFCVRAGTNTSIVAVNRSVLKVLEVQPAALTDPGVPRAMWPARKSLALRRTGRVLPSA